MTSQRYCAAPGCGKPLVRRVGEALRDFTRRRSCNQTCGNSLMRINRGGRPRKPARPGKWRCHFCDAPARLKKSGEAKMSCASPECIAAESNQRNPDYSPAWPEHTGEITASKELFGRFNIDPDEERGSIPLRPATHVAKEANT